VRLALGARAPQLVSDIVREGLLLAAAGSAIGVCGAALAAQLLRHQLYGVRPNDLPSFAATLAVLGVTCALACWLPARRALSANPMEALRAE
jgi:ABC-type antimicrobial peptide transport system permease subunit